MKVDLKDTTFIIPIKIESHDRMRNVITILCFLLDNFDTKVILKEVDTDSVFKNEVLPQIEGYVEDSIQNLINTNKIELSSRLVDSLIVLNIKRNDLFELKLIKSESI